MDHNRIKQDLLITMEILKIRETPALIEEIVHYFINTQKTPVTNSDITESIRELEKAGQAFLNDEGFVSFSQDINSLVSNRFRLEEATREKIKYSQKVLKFLNRFPFIKFIGAVGESSLGRIAKNEEIKLIIITDKDASYLSKFIVKNYLKLRFALKNFHIEKILESNNLRCSEYHPLEGIKLLNIIPIVNKNKFHEKFLGSNNWIFELFSNYPLEKVSWGFRMSKGEDVKVSGFVKTLNNLLKPKG